ncbi:hypothetical protein RPD_1905 [Rhodopseudomonas palustris BisB5]|uniref:Uncharacterized protein n=1 Tax=Rhodopseudomonas palustris (strain BisB5) TaxID=316057 RepID=Q139U9_RHOPS|nr:hypothetical protein RPD_1905 [Rhodopseudomonas palustris BisB5]
MLPRSLFAAFLPLFTLSGVAGNILSPCVILITLPVLISHFSHRRLG